MLTIFACPKPFTDPHIAMIQGNAIRSWTLLKPAPTVVLFGNEEGIAEAARDIGVQHIEHAAQNERGAPILSDVFSRAEQTADSHILCYVNADIILLQDFVETIGTVQNQTDRFMMGGRPWNIRVNEPLQFQPGWADPLRAEVASNGELRGEYACDYFAYPRGVWGALPDFLLGRGGFDNGLMYLARRRGLALVDATASVTAIHQHHGYPKGLGPATYTEHPDSLQNTRLAGGLGCLYSWRYATHRVDNGVATMDWNGYSLHWRTRLQQELWFPLRAATKPIRRMLAK